jgi:hypothetical protein
MHFNAGATITPDVSVSRRDLEGYNLGASIFIKPETYFNIFVEALALWNEEITNDFRVTDTTQVFVNPGVRYAVCQFEDVEWVLGASVPIGLTPDTPEAGAFVYMSVEHVFRKQANSDCAGQ